MIKETTKFNFRVSDEPTSVPIPAFTSRSTLVALANTLYPLLPCLHWSMQMYHCYCLIESYTSTKFAFSLVWDTATFFERKNKYIHKLMLDYKLTCLINIVPLKIINIILSFTHLHVILTYISSKRRYFEECRYCLPLTFHCMDQNGKTKQSKTKLN